MKVLSPFAKSIAVGAFILLGAICGVSHAEELIIPFVGDPEAPGDPTVPADPTRLTLSDIEPILAFFGGHELGHILDVDEKSVVLVLTDPTATAEFAIAVTRENSDICNVGGGGPSTNQIFDLPCNPNDWFLIHYVIFFAGVAGGTVLSACDSLVRPSIVVIFD